MLPLDIKMFGKKDVVQQLLKYGCSCCYGCIFKDEGNAGYVVDLLPLSRNAPKATINFYIRNILFILWVLLN
jgi:hypothetical protein